MANFVCLGLGLIVALASFIQQMPSCLHKIGMQVFMRTSDVILLVEVKMVYLGILRKVIFFTGISFSGLIVNRFFTYYSYV